MILVMCEIAAGRQEYCYYELKSGDCMLDSAPLRKDCTPQRIESENEDV